ncbi:MAG: TPM domain-containing protein [Kiritimatiellia bacterium]
MRETSGAAWRWAVTLSLFLTVFFCATVSRGRSIPPLTGRVVDSAGVLSVNEKATLERLLQGVEQATGGQVAVLLERQLPEGESLESYTLAVATAWRIGHKGVDNGALLYLALDDRRSRLEVGYGWEPYINDARAGDILRAMAPLLQIGETAAAVTLAAKKVSFFVSHQMPVPTVAEQSQGPRWFHVLIALVAVALFIRYPWLFLLLFSGGRGGRGGGGFGGFGGGSFGGGGGGFGGGGASGRW